MDELTLSWIKCSWITFMFDSQIAKVCWGTMDGAVKPGVEIPMAIIK